LKQDLEKPKNWKKKKKEKAKGRRKGERGGWGQGQKNRILTQGES